MNHTWVFCTGRSGSITCPIPKQRLAYIVTAAGSCLNLCSSLIDSLEAINFYLILLRNLFVTPFGQVSAAMTVSFFIGSKMYTNG